MIKVKAKLQITTATNIIQSSRATPPKPSGFSGTELCRHPKPGIGDVEEEPVVLLHHAGDDVDVAGGGGHGETGGAAGGAVNEEVILRQRHVHAREQERYCRRCYGLRVACVESSQ